MIVKKAGDEARTHDIHLGKVTLYQLSYTRKIEIQDYKIPVNLTQSKNCNGRSWTLMDKMDIDSVH